MGNAQSIEVKVYKACRKNDVESLQALIRQSRELQRHRFDSNSVLEFEDPDGRTPLLIAAAKGHYQCVELLLQYGANVAYVNRKSLEGGTALHEAVANQHDAIAALLLHNGCSPAVENAKGLTAFDLAIKNNHLSLLRRLEHYAWFRSYMLVKRRNMMGAKSWVRRWLVVVPRYPCPALPAEQRTGFHTMLLVYKSEDAGQPFARVFLNGASAAPALPKHARGAQRPSAMYPLQLTVTLHISHKPTPVAFSADGREGLVVHVRPETDNLTDCSMLRQLMDIINTQRPPAAGSSPLGPAVPSLPPGALPQPPQTPNPHLPPLMPTPRSSTASIHLSPTPSLNPTPVRPTPEQRARQPSRDATPGRPSVDSPYGGTIPAGPSAALLRDEEYARRLQQQLDEEAAQAQAAGPVLGVGSAGPLQAMSRAASCRSASVGGADGPLSRLPSAPARTPSWSQAGSHRKSPSAPPITSGASTTTPLPDDSNLCVVCLEGPQEAGFLHGSTVHRCCCKGCTEKLKRQNVRQCPLCREEIDHYILQVY